MSGVRGTRLELSQLRTDLGTQARAAVNPAVVAEYAEALESGDQFPSVVVFEVAGVGFVLVDGFHRFEAHREAGLDAIDCNVRTGTMRDALLWAAGANARHGLRRSTADKLRAVCLLLEADETKGLSSHALAKAAAVSDQIVRQARQIVEGRTARPPIEQPAAEASAEPDDEPADEPDVVQVEPREPPAGRPPSRAGTPMPAPAVARRVEPPPAEPTPPTAPAAEPGPACDPNGRPMPPHLADLFADNWHANAARLVRMVANELPAILDWNHWMRPELVEELTAAAAAIEAAAPHAVCPDCRGADLGCGACRRTGFLPVSVPADGGAVDAAGR